MGDNVTRTSDRFGGYGSELTADQLAAIQGANDPSATNVFITEDDLSDLPAGSDEKVKYNTDDPTAGYLADKIIAGTNVTIEEGTGADENKLKISATIGSTTDELVKYNAGDTVAGYLADKVIAGDGITIAEGTGADENKLVVTNSTVGDYVTEVTVVNDETFPISYLQYVKNGVTYDITEIPKSSGRIEGGDVSWVELLKFDVSAAAYYLEGILYTTESARAILDAADALLPRIDIIIIDNTETVSVITGVPNANPQKPTVDPVTQIELTNILVPAGATAPGLTITQEIIYNENAEWVGSSSGVTVDFADVAQPYDKTVATLVGTLTNNDTITYTKSATSVAHESFENFIFNIRLNATVANQHNLYVRWLEDGVSVSNEVRVPLNKSNITSYQNINMSLSLWTWNQNNVDAVQFRWSRSGGAVSHAGFYLDLLKLEKGITVIPSSSGIELVGDVTGTGVTGSPVPTALATVNASPGTYGNATNVPQVTVDGKGRVTAISNIAVSISDEKVKYDAGDPTAGYIADKIVSGTGISVAEGTGVNENKLVITNDSPAAAETDPVVGAVNGLVKANGAGVISAASAGTDYQTPLTKAAYTDVDTGTDDTKYLTSLALRGSKTAFEVTGYCLSDETSDLEVGERLSVNIPFDFLITRVYATVKTAPTGSNLQIDVEDGGTTILNTVLNIAASGTYAETSTFTGATSSYQYHKNDLLTFDIDQIGSTIAGAGLKVFLEGYR